MSYFDRVVDRIEKNKSREFNAIPIGLPRFSKYYPGIEKGVYTLLSSGPKVGKSFFTDNCYVYNAYDFIQGRDIKLKIFYYSMEMSLEEMLIRGISRRVSKKFDIILKREDILSLNENRMSQEKFDMIYSTREYFEKLEDVLIIKEGSINPYGIFKEVDDYCKNNGHFDQGKYVDNDEFRLVILDHVSLLSAERGMDKRQTIEKFSVDCVSNRNKYGVSYLINQQQTLDKERAQYTNSGQVIEDRFEPSIDGLADNKATSRDCTTMLTLYAPHRHHITKHNGLNIAQYGEHYRSLKITLNRNGEADVCVPLYIDVNKGEIREL